MLGVFVFNESPPSSAGSAASANAVTGTDPSSTAGILSASELEGFEQLTLTLEAQGNGGGTLDVYVQTLIAGHWYDYCHFKQLGIAAAAIKYQYIAGRSTQTSGTVIGVDATPALASDVIIGGVWGEAFRLWMVSGASTSSSHALKVTVIGQLARGPQR